MSDMDPVLELKGRPHPSREAPVNKEPVDAMKELENNHMNHTNNGELKSINTEDGTNKQTEEALNNQDVEVNMLESTKLNDTKRIEEEKCDDVDLTESSSSFDSNGTSFTDAEDDPDLYDDALSSLPCDGYRELSQMRKKKLIPSWKKYVEPLKWRCKWIELQIKKFEFQARKYERKIAEYNTREQLENSKLENVNSESLPFSSQGPKMEFLKRKKRRRAEDTEEITSYMSQHNLFSYFENKKYNAGAMATDGYSGNQGDAALKSTNGDNEIGINDELILRVFNDRSNILEQIFWKIGVTQWQVSEMSSRVHKLLSENASRISSSENLSLHVSSNNSLTSSTENSASLKNKNGNIKGSTKTVDLAMPDTATLKLGEPNHVSEDIKSIDSQKIGGSTRNPTGMILMYNRRAKMNRNISKEVNIVSSTEDRQGSPHQVSKPSSPNTRNSLSKTMLENTAGTRSFKRKRAMRKAGSGKWVEIQNE